MAGQIIAVLILLALSFLFSMVEYGYVSMTPMALEKISKSKALSDRLRRRMTANHSMLISVIILGNNLANLGSSFLFARVVLSMFKNVNVDLLSIASTLVLTAAVVVFAETIPKSLGRAFPEEATRSTSVLLYPMFLLLYPVAWVLSKISGAFTRPVLRHAKHNGYISDPEDFQYLLKMGQEDGVIDKEEERLIHNIFDYTNTLAYEIMTPFVDVATVEKTAHISEAVRTINDTGHSRLPVMDDDNVVGIIYAKDALKAMAGGASPQITTGSMMRQPFFAPDTKKISKLLQEMQQQRIQTAVLFDEYGAVSGLITVEDILEEVFGEIQDEFDKEAPEIESAGHNAFLIKGSVSTEKASELLSAELSGEDYDTVAGLMLSEIGRLPRVGDRVEHGGVVFTVVNVVGKRISRVRAERIEMIPRSVEGEE